MKRWTGESLDKVREKEGLGVKYFEIVKDIMLDEPSYDNLWHRGILINVAVLECVDLVLKQYQEALEDYEYARKDVEKPEEPHESNDELQKAEEWLQETRNSLNEQEKIINPAMDALTVYLERYPEEFGGHLRMTFPVFGYAGLYDISIERVQNFWSKVSGVVAQWPSPSNKGIRENIQWLVRESKLVLSGRKRGFIPREE